MQIVEFARIGFAATDDLQIRLVEVRNVALLQQQSAGHAAKFQLRGALVGGNAQIAGREHAQIGLGGKCGRGRRTEVGRDDDFRELASRGWRARWRHRARD